MQGYFGGKVDLFFQRFLEIWSSIPSLYVLLIISAVLSRASGRFSAYSCSSIGCRSVGVVRAEFLRGRNFEYIKAARALGLSNVKIMFKHLLPNAMVATLTFLPFISQGSDRGADLTRLPWSRPAARVALARRIAATGQGQHAGALARPHRLLLDRRPELARSSSARPSATPSTPARPSPFRRVTRGRRPAPLRPGPRRRLPLRRHGATRRRAHVSFDIDQGRDGRARRRSRGRASR